MNNPALKGEVSIKEKMLSQTNTRLRRNFAKFSSGSATASSFHNNFIELNFKDGNSSLGLNAPMYPCR